MRLAGCGGSAHVLDLATGETVEWLDCENWLAERLAETSASPATAVPPSRVSVFGVAAAERLLREMAENHRGLLAVEPDLTRAIDSSLHPSSSSFLWFPNHLTLAPATTSMTQASLIIKERSINRDEAEHRNQQPAIPDNLVRIYRARLIFQL